MNDDLMISTTDAEALALMLGDRSRRDDRAADLIEVLQLADIVPDDRFPLDRVAMGKAVTYEDADDGTPRRIVLVWPAVAAPEDGLVSVLTPVGTALLGRCVDDEAEVALPNGRVRTVKILAVDPVGAHVPAASHEGRAYA